MANGILIIDKFQDWTSSGLGLIERETAGAGPAYPRGHPLLFAANPLRWALLRETEGSQCLTES